MVPNRDKFRLNKAFSLLEISIVIMIISLLAGIVSMGYHIQNNSSLRAVVREMNQFKSLAQTFKLRYGYFPGDFPYATNYWYNATTCPGTNGVAGSCNGNGNGYINNASPCTTSCEPFRAWQHLYLAEIISNSYSGVGVKDGECSVGINCPSSEYKGIGYLLFQMDWLEANERFNRLVLGIPQGNGWVFGPSFPVSDAYFIDNKIDDGLPMAGLVTASDWPYTNNCILTPWSISSTYVLNSNNGGPCLWMGYILEN